MEPKKIGVGFGVMILNKGKILFGQRHVNPEKADSELHGEGTWTMPGGKLHFGESFEQGGAREVLEETGMVIDPKDLKVIAINNDLNEHAHFITIGLLYEGEVADPKVMEPDEITQWRWFPIGSLPNPIFFPSKKIVENYLKQDFYLN